MAPVSPNLQTDRQRRATDVLANVRFQTVRQRQMDISRYLRNGAMVIAALLTGPRLLSAQDLQITPFVGYESAGSYPLENPTTIQARRADAAESYGAYIDYRMTDSLRAEFSWVSNHTTYSEQSVATGRYGDGFPTSINQYQFGALYLLGDPGGLWRPYLAGSLGFTHDSSNEATSRTALGFSVGGGIEYQPVRHFGLRGDLRWMPTYGSSSPSSNCDDFGDCFPQTAHHYLQRINFTLGITVSP